MRITRTELRKIPNVPKIACVFTYVILSEENGKLHYHSAVCTKNEAKRDVEDVKLYLGKTTAKYYRLID